MPKKYNYVTVDTILSKYLRDFRGGDFNEDDALEWIGEALGFIKAPNLSEEAIAFLEVKNYQINVPEGLHYIIQIAKNNMWSAEETSACTPSNIVSELVSDPSCSDCSPCGGNSNLVPVNCQGEIIGDTEVAYYRPYFDLQYEYTDWANSKGYRTKFTPVRLADHTFFNTLVCQTEETKGLYSNHNNYEEYSIIQNQIRFSFKEGFVAVAYVRTKLDPDTGYPMVPDDESAKSAITYYLAWKTKQREAYNHREGAKLLAEEAEQRWLKYCKQFRNAGKMPYGIDDYQDLLEQSTYLIPRKGRYYDFFGNLSRMEDRTFTDPDFKNKFTVGHRPHYTY
jgi:hypothetical protein